MECSTSTRKSGKGLCSVHVHTRRASAHSMLLKLCVSSPKQGVVMLPACVFFHLCVRHAVAHSMLINFCMSGLRRLCSCTCHKLKSAHQSK
eukprot:scaffold136426_cov19-Tisochrysis_lutea.AAC.1